MPPAPSPHALIRTLRPSTSSALPRSLYRRTPLSPARISRRALTTTPSYPSPSKPPTSHDRGPASTEETQTDFGALNILGGTTAPTTGIDACTNDGFALNSGLRISGSGVLLVGGEVFRWRPWLREGRVEGTIGGGGKGNDKGAGGGGVGKMRDARGMWEVDEGAWGVLDLVWPKPDLLIVGTGPTIVPISPKTRKHINELGIRLEVSDTRNASAQFNLLATERGVTQVAAALVPMGWKEGR
ncbi:hypothetical protein H2201_003552 [Coniosporium apollinis]|uniref:NADH dehydrogenase [ubiquinone] 1 alpha subcomplex assembly factor 3 n=1 Tax=Coniosporium apollinis TaxID=61459 RepID=A0ABQ9NYI9_9PEZI|nr:hypothetical protein H2201_003552 [Coniosporium apollinis]